MALSPFRARVLTTDGEENIKHFESNASAIGWAMEVWKKHVGAEVELAEVWRADGELVWTHDRRKHLLANEVVSAGLGQSAYEPFEPYEPPPPRLPAPRLIVEAECSRCGKKTKHTKYSKPLFSFRKPPLRLKCAECFMRRSEDAPRP